MSYSFLGLVNSSDALNYVSFPPQDEFLSRDTHPQFVHWYISRTIISRHFFPNSYFCKIIFWFFENPHLRKYHYNSHNGHEIEPNFDRVIIEELILTIGFPSVWRRRLISFLVDIDPFYRSVRLEVSCSEPITARHGFTPHLTWREFQAQTLCPWQFVIRPDSTFLKVMTERFIS